MPSHIAIVQDREAVLSDPPDHAVVDPAALVPHRQLLSRFSR
ncbi:hypothetical protein L083_8087 [Actinoplanes sp. N902-109]|nr:hypothetical protein L083_8087 [Actinoplanes sp. N902-109]